MRQPAGILLIALVVLWATACGGNGDDTGAGGGTEDTGGQAEADLTVEVFSFGFDPNPIEVPAGEEVTIEATNTSDIPHTFSSEALGFDQQLAAGQSATVTFTAPDSGSAPFQCDIHPDRMQGEIVTGGSAGGGGNGGGGADY